MSTNTSPTGFAVAGFASPQGQQGPSLSLVTKEEYLEVVGENNASEVKRGEAQMFWKINASIPGRPDLPPPSYHITDHMPDELVRSYLQMSSSTIYMLLSSISDAYKEGYRVCYDPKTKKVTGPDLYKEATLRVLRRQIDLGMNDAEFLKKLLNDLSQDGAPSAFAMGSMIGWEVGKAKLLASKVNKWLDRTSRDRPKLDASGKQRTASQPKASPPKNKPKAKEILAPVDKGTIKIRKPGSGRPKGTKNKPKITTGTTTSPITDPTTNGITTVATTPPTPPPHTTDSFSSSNPTFSAINNTANNSNSVNSTQTSEFRPAKRPQGRPKGSTKDKSKTKSTPASITATATNTTTAVVDGAIQKKPRKPGSGRPKGSWGKKKRESLMMLEKAKAEGIVSTEEEENGGGSV